MMNSMIISTEAVRLRKLGTSRAMAGDEIGAIQAFRKSVETDPCQPDVWHELAAERCILQDFHGAIDAFRQVLAIQPDNIDAWVGLGNALLSIKDKAGSADAVRKAINILLNRNSEPSKPALSYTGCTVASWIYKLIVAGASGSDKTALIQRSCTNSFIIDHKMTFGAAFSIKDITFENGVSVKLQIWDFATQERFRSLLGDYCRGASGAFVCFDVTDYETFAQVPAWIDIIRKEARDVPIMLVGTKSEQPNHQVPYDLAAQYAQAAGCVGAAYCSSTTATNVEAVFQNMAEWMVYFQTKVPD